MQLRSAKPIDFCAQIPDLIWSEDPELLALEFQNFETWAKVAEAEWPATGVGNSHDATTLAVQDGAVVGLMNGFPTSEMLSRFEKTEALRGSTPLSDTMCEAIDTLFPMPEVDTFYVLDIAVAASSQNRGLGVALMDHADELARAAGCSAICLDVRETNPAVGFYQHLGFEVTKRSDAPALRDYGIKAYLQMTRAIRQ